MSDTTPPLKRRPAKGSPLLPHGSEEDGLIEQRLDVRRAFHAAIDRPWLLVCCVLLAVLASVLYLRRATPEYSAAAVLKYEPHRGRMVDFAELTESTTKLDEIRTQIEIIRSPNIIGRVIDSLGLDAGGTAAAQGPSAGLLAGVMENVTDLKNRLSRRLVTYEVLPLDAEVASRQRLEQGLAGSLRVRQVDDTRLIEITVSDRDRYRAARLADEFARQYILSLQDETRRAYQDASLWFAGQLAEARNELAEAEKTLSDYKGTNDIRVLEQNHHISTEAMRSLSLDIQRTLDELAELKSRQQVLEDEELRPALLADDQRTLTMLNKLRALELDRVASVMENTPSHPSVVRLDREIEVLRNQLDSASGELLNETKARQQIARINLESLRERLHAQEDLVQTIQEEMIQYRVLEREVESAREIYASLLDRSKQIAVTADISAPAVTILSNAKIPEYPSSPKIMRTVVLFGLFGVFCGFGLVLLADRMDRSVKDPREAENRLGIATLGSIPYLKEPGGLLGRKRAASPIISNYDPKSRESESFRILRTALQYSHADKPPQILLVSSSHPQEGKSTVSANLAVSHAQRGDRVLLIDCDLKRSTMHNIFEIPREPGLTDILTGHRKLEDVVAPSGVEGLDLLPSGPNAPSPGDLLESRSMRALLEDLRTRYDVVVVDSAPLTGIADSLVLTHFVDGICLVVNQGKTPMDSLAKVVTLLDRVEAPLLGLIFNRRDRRGLSVGRYGGYTYYGYGYVREGS